MLVEKRNSSKFTFKKRLNYVVILVRKSYLWYMFHQCVCKKIQTNRIAYISFFTKNIRSVAKNKEFHISKWFNISINTETYCTSIISLDIKRKVFLNQNTQKFRLRLFVFMFDKISNTFLLLIIFSRIKNILLNIFLN